MQVTGEVKRILAEESILNAKGRIDLSKLAFIDEGMSVFEAPIPFSMSIPQDVLDQILRLAGNRDSGRMNIVNEFSKGKTIEEIADYLQHTFRGGNGIITDEGRCSAWYAEDGKTVHERGDGKQDYQILTASKSSGYPSGMARTVLQLHSALTEISRSR